MTLVNVHFGASDNGNYNSRGSLGCITINPDNEEEFFDNFTWTNSTNTTGSSSREIKVVRAGDTDR